MNVFTAFDITNIVNAMKITNRSFFSQRKNKCYRRFCKVFYTLKAKVNLLLSPEVYKVGSHTVLLTASEYVSFRKPM
jgi:hypothetical protein